MPVNFGEFSLDRMVNAVEKVRQRLLRSAAALQAYNIPYAIVGGNAVALWVSRVDEAAVRNTQDVDILPAATTALESAGFLYRHANGLDMFLDGPHAKARDALHIVFANESVKGSQPPNPDVSASESAGSYQVLSLDALVQIKLTAFRDKDRTHLRDMIDVGIIDPSWIKKYPPELGHRLQSLFDDPNG
ncbi:MAG TPA: hypothetical protein VFE58_14025 [Tepidisphaeraceae bacterium]|jgi:hypothetical protein|nr:hypothetical protein [Tepidisphaeraceae bacterium]